MSNLSGARVRADDANESAREFSPLALTLIFCHYGYQNVTNTEDARRS
jgi:hypothetical protein